MKSANPYPIHPKHLRNAAALRRATPHLPSGNSAPQPPASITRTTPRDFVNPVDYQHPYDSMSRFATALALRYDANRTRHAYYRQLRLIHEHFGIDPALVTEAQLRDYFLHVKLQKHCKRHDWQVDPDVWGRNWGVHIQPAGNGGAALRYLGAYVARTAIGDGRILHIGDATVSFRWKNRDAANRPEVSTIPGVEFVARYLRHVLPRGLRSIRYYGFCHPSARVQRLRVQCHAGGPVQLGASMPLSPPPAPIPLCPCCRRPMLLAAVFSAPYRQRGPPAIQKVKPSHPTRS